MNEQPDLFEARAARDEALERVAENSGNYTTRAIYEIRRMHGKLIGEEIRLAVEKIIGFAHHHNAWGAIINTAVRQNILLKTGHYRQMKTKRSHARATPEYEVNR